MAPFIASFKSPNFLLRLPSSPHLTPTSLRNGSLFFFSALPSRIFTAKIAVHSEASTSMEFVKETIKHASGEDRIALRAEKKSYSYLQLISSALDISNILRSNIINGSACLDGARVGIAAKPSPEFVAGLFGTWLCGGVAVPLALSYPEAELLHVMNDSVSSSSLLFYLSFPSHVLYLLGLATFTETFWFERADLPVGRVVSGLRFLDLLVRQVGLGSECYWPEWT